MLQAGFRFKPLCGAVDWRAVATTDVQSVTDATNVQALLRRLDDVQKGDVKAPGGQLAHFWPACELIPALFWMAGYYADPNLVKALQLGQLSVQYLAYTQVVVAAGSNLV
jgi:hypothetical protein